MNPTCRCMPCIYLDDRPHPPYPAVTKKTCFLSASGVSIQAHRCIKYHIFSSHACMRSHGTNSHAVAEHVRGTPAYACIQAGRQPGRAGGPRVTKRLFGKHHTCPAAATCGSPACLHVLLNLQYLNFVAYVLRPGGIYAGDVVLPYIGPQPPVGIHRYVLVLFEQKSRIVDGYAAPPADRAYFNTRAFAANHDLGLPVAVVYFNSQREPSANRRRR